jgi:osomolarity two-component system, sensor histidine kinase SLN1
MPTLRTLAEKGRNSSNAGMPTPATSTAVDDTLPVPVLARNPSFSIRRKRKSARFGGFAVYWAKLKRSVGTGTAPSSSSVVGDSAAESSYTRRMEAHSDGEEVNEVVVDRVWSEEIKSSVSQSEHGATPEKSGSSHPMGPSSSDHDSLYHEGFWNLSSHLVVLRWRAWPFIVKFFSSSFADEKSEQHYAQVWQTFQPVMLLTYHSYTIGELVHKKISCYVGFALAYS